MKDLWGELQSPNVLLIREHYREFRLDKMDNKRVGRLCAIMQVTLEELCALAGVFGKTRVRALHKDAEKKGHWPSEVALHFAKFERYIGERTFYTASEPDPQDIQMSVLLNR